MIRLVITALVLGALTATSSIAADAKPTGKWSHTAGGFEIVLDFAKDSVIMTVDNSGNSITATCTSTVEDDGTVKLKITKVEEKGSFPEKPPVGLQISFVWKADGKTATLKDFKGDNIDEAKNIVEGEYTLKK